MLLVMPFNGIIKVCRSMGKRLSYTKPFIAIFGLIVAHISLCYNRAVLYFTVHNLEIVV